MSDDVPAAAPEPAPNSNPGSSSQGASPKRADDPIEISFWREVQDANELLDFAVASGFRNASGQSVPTVIIVAIKEVTQIAVATDRKELPPPDLRARFEQAYLDLATLLSPITVTTLRDTSEDSLYKVRSWLAPRGQPFSTVWNRKMTAWTLFFIAVAIASSIVDRLSDTAATSEQALSLLLPKTILDIVQPFAYGGIGACAFLLKSLHTFIHQRCFDRHRTAEYYNRILLGVVSGGTITLLVNELVADNGDTIALSARALGFIAGYNTDFLFSAIERIAAAILPKVGITSVTPAPSPPSVPVSLGQVSLEDLLRRYDQATTPEQKALLETLIKRLTDRL